MCLDDGVIAHMPTFLATYRCIRNALVFKIVVSLHNLALMSKFSPALNPDEDLNLMCHMIMDDSSWLDSFQKSVLNGEGKVGQNRFLHANLAHQFSCSALDFSPANPVCSEQPQLKSTKIDSSAEVAIHRLRRSKSHEVLRFHSVHAFESRTIDAPTTVVDQLPAPEFVDGTRSMIACESFRMISTVAAMHGSNSANYRRFDNV